MLDTKLNFVGHVNMLKKSILSKMYAIKRIFYLSFNVKMLFFKTFLLPYFDYCLSLIIYFSKTAINTFAKIYYLCLYKLFYFNFNNSNTHQINSRLNCFSLSSFEYRCMYKFFDFSYNIKYNRHAPKELSAILREDAR